jgi:hypothetical protein
MKTRLCSGLTVAAAALLLLLAAQASAGVSRVDDGIEFTYSDPYAGSVNLAGQFNNWSANATPLEKDDEGTWRVVLDLAPGAYEYKFVVNGSEWIADPDNPVVVGDYGNSEVTVTEGGEPVFEGAGAAISNTAVNARVNLNGWYRATYETRSDLPSDPRWRLDRPEHEFYVSVNPTIGSRVKGGGTIRLSSGAGDIKEIHADIYSGHLDLEGGPFSVSGWYNEESVQFDNPLEHIGHIDLDGTIAEEHIPFGRGAQGVDVSAAIGGFELTAVYSNLYDFDIYDDPSVYDNTDTDLMAARLTRSVGPFGVGATYSAFRDGWWIDWTGTNESPHLDEFIASTGSASDWFELSSTNRLIGIDVDWPVMSERVYLQAEYAAYSYDGLWDVGNKEKVEGEDYSNGAIDVPFGDTAGRIAVAAVQVPALRPLTIELETTRFKLDGMSADEEYVAFGDPAWWDWVGPAGHSTAFLAHALREYTEVRYDGSPLLATVYAPLPEYESWDWRLDAGLTFGIFDLWMEFDRTTFKGSFADSLDWLGGTAEFEGWTERLAGSVEADVLPDRLEVGLETELLSYDLLLGDALTGAAGELRPLDTFEAILRGKFGIAENWSVLTDLRYIVYGDVPTAIADTSSRGAEYDDESFFAPYVALVYSPRENIEVRLGYGVDPISYADAPVEGRPNGRERWRSRYLWEHSEHDVLDAEQAMADARTIGVMAVISF